MFIGRENEIHQMNEWKDKHVIKVITGLRRVGKSKILQEFIKDNLSSSNVIYYDFNKIELEKLTYPQLYDEIIKKSKNNQTNYVILDEIQEITNFEKCIIGLYENTTFKFDIYLTGSNSHMFSSELRTLFSGRKIELSIFPLSYNELFRSLKISLNDYLKFGGLGVIVSYYSNEQLIKKYLSEIFNDTIVKDAIERYKIKNTRLFEAILEYTFKTIGKNTNYSNIFNYLKTNSKKSNYSLSSIIRMNGQICESMILMKVKYFDNKAKSELSNKAKFYCGDLGLLNSKINFSVFDSFRGVRIENLIFLELKKRGYDVFTYCDKNNTEIDFIAFKENDYTYIQVCDELNNDNYKREVGNLLKVKVAFKKVVLYLTNTAFLEEDGVKKIEISRWLKNEIDW
ncbi:MAG: ATP-binding protein [Mycoplasmataceae bacterium]|nr:ATP-binding protein [Mycoplasmataceae bacterium]